MTEVESCSYTNPDTGQACQCLKCVPSHKKQNFIAYDPVSDRDWCLIHFPRGETKESWNSDKQIETFFKEHIAAVVRHTDPIDLSGARFSASNLPPLPRDKALILDDADIDDSLKMQSPMRAISGKRMTLGGSFEVGGVVAEDIDLEAAVIGGSLTIIKGYGSLKCKEVRLGGTVTVSEVGNTGERVVSFQGASIDGDLVVHVEGKKNLLDFGQGTIVGSVSIRASGGGGKLLGNGLTVTGDVTINGPFALVRLNDAVFAGPVTLLGEITELRAIRAKVNNLLTFEKFSATTVQLRGLESKSVFSMIGATVSDLLDCGDVHFAELAYFMASKLEKATFYGARFDSTAMFCATQFVVGANFEKIIAKHPLDFAPKWKGGSIDANVKELPRLTFDDADLNEIDFAGRAFEAEATFSGVKFGKAPNFFNCRLHESVTFPLSLENYADRSEESRLRYRTLKQKMEAARARPEEAVFFALEQYCSRPGLPWIGKLISIFYGKTSQYGWSIGKPIFYLTLWVLLFSLIFGQIEVGSIEWPRTIDWHAAGLGFKTSVQNVFLPFYAVRDSGSSVAEMLLSILQSLVSIALIAEMLLAVRWRFRRG